MKCIVFDAWGVIYPPGDDVGTLLIPFLRSRGWGGTTERVHELYFDASVGRISPRQFWEGLGLGAQYPDVERQYLDTAPQIDPQFAPLAERLAGAYELAVLSNDVGAWAAHLRRRFGIDRFLRTAVISSEVGIRKPDRRIFEELFRRLGTEPAQCLYVDDRAKNTRAAVELGMTAVRFDRGTDYGDGDFRTDLVIRGLPELLAYV